MHLNLFLPALERSQRGTADEPPGAILRAARALLPSALFSDPRSGRPGLLRRILKALGPTWLAAPLRRLTQTVCLLLFFVLLLYVVGAHGSPPFAQAREAKEIIPAEFFLVLDPLVSTSAALAARAWVWSLVWAGVILLISVVIPRGFCGYMCPLGTLIDLFDSALGRRMARFKVERRGWWAQLKYYILTGVLMAALCGVLLSGFVAAIPLLTRGMAYTLGPLQLGLVEGWHVVPALSAWQYLSIVLFLAVLALGFLRPRFWCRYVCPTGAVFSAATLLRLTERKVSPSCIQCGRCVEACPFDAIKADFTTRPAECTFCQTCGGVCSAGAITFGGRWGWAAAKPESAGPTGEIDLSRRGFLTAGLGGVAIAAGLRASAVSRSLNTSWVRPVRPPGSVPEERFVRACIRCGECMQACPTRVLQPTGIESGLLGLWTPRAAADWAGCDPTCNNCGQVCPTGAIRALPPQEKRVARMGLAVVNQRTCLPHSGREPCQMCVDQCRDAGYKAIEFLHVHVELDEYGLPVEDSGFLAPVVVAEKCVGCGLCQSRCYAINVAERRVLSRSAVQVVAGPGKEDRLMRGSYLKLREEERRAREQAQRSLRQEGDSTDTYLPDFLR